MLKIRTRLEEKGRVGRKIWTFSAWYSARKETIMELDHRETSSKKELEILEFEAGKSLCDIQRAPPAVASILAPTRFVSSAFSVQAQILSHAFLRLPLSSFLRRLLPAKQRERVHHLH
jgi:hypothetical protein